MEIITFFKTLMVYAKELGEARKAKEPRRIDEAKIKFDSYREQVLKSDRMII